MRRRLDGLLQGDHQGRLGGAGSEPGDARTYVAGDDVRRIDWSVTARTGDVHVRDTIADHELDLTLVVDTSASLAFGTTRATKQDVAHAAAMAFALLTARGGNRVGLLTTGEPPLRVPHRGGERHLAALWRQLRTAQVQGPGDLAGALRTARRSVARRGVVVVLSDYLDDGVWLRELRGLAHRHDVVAAEIVDPRELTMPDVGLLHLVDPETGRRRRLDTSDDAMRERFQKAASRRRLETKRAVVRGGASHILLRTDRDVVADIVRWLGTRRRAAARGA